MKKHVHVWLVFPELMEAGVLELSGWFSACSHRGWVLGTCHRTLFNASLSCLETDCSQFLLIFREAFTEQVFSTLYFRYFVVILCNASAPLPITTLLANEQKFTILHWRSLLFILDQKAMCGKSTALKTKFSNLLHIVEMKKMWISICECCRCRYNSGKQWTSWNRGFNRAHIKLCWDM